MDTTPDQYWASFFGIGIAEFMRPGLQVVPHCGLHDYQGAWLFQRDSSSIISVPAGLVNEIKGKVSESPSLQDFVALFGEKATKTVGPAYHGHLEQLQFVPVDSSARVLSLHDIDALHKLRASCDQQEWEHSDIHFQVDQSPTFGVIADGDLVAACNYRMEAEGVAALGIVTHSPL